MRRSLSARLLVALLALSALVWAVVGTGMLVGIRTEALALTDRKLENIADILMSLTAQELIEHANDPGNDVGPASSYRHLRTHLHEYPGSGGVAYHLHGANHVFHFQSRGYPDDIVLTTAPAGLSSETVGGELWRVFTRYSEDRAIQVQVAEPQTRIDAMLRALGVTVVAPIAVGLPLLALLTWIVLNRGLRPLRRLAGSVAARAPGTLEPVDSSAAPTEALPLVEAINDLVARLEARIEAERRFSADAAHELRTPLARLRLLADGASAARDPRRYAEIMHGLVEGTERANRLVAQLLMLARVESGSELDRREVLSLGACVQGAVAEVAPGAIAKGIALSLDEGDERPIRGDSDLLAVLARNLVENAVRYTPADGAVAVRVIDTGPEVALIVSDSGPGIPAEERARIFERFYRGNQRSEVEGSGLGLSIVDRIARLHGARLELGEDPDLGGLRVEVAFAAHTCRPAPVSSPSAAA